MGCCINSSFELLQIPVSFSKKQLMYRIKKQRGELIGVKEVLILNCNYMYQEIYEPDETQPELNLSKRGGNLGKCYAALKEYEATEYSFNQTTNVAGRILPKTNLQQ
jgi:hypothetical protein